MFSLGPATVTLAQCPSQTVTNCVCCCQHWKAARDAFRLNAGHQTDVGLAKELRIPLPPPHYLSVQMLFGRTVLRVGKNMYNVE